MEKLRQLLSIYDGDRTSLARWARQRHREESNKMMGPKGGLVEAPYAPFSLKQKERDMEAYGLHEPEPEPELPARQSTRELFRAAAGRLAEKGANKLASGAEKIGWTITGTPVDRALYQVNKIGPLADRFGRKASSVPERIADKASVALFNAMEGRGLVRRGAAGSSLPAGGASPGAGPMPTPRPVDPAPTPAPVPVESFAAPLSDTVPDWALHQTGPIPASPHGLNPSVPDWAIQQESPGPVGSGARPAPAMPRPEPPGLVDPASAPVPAWGVGGGTGAGSAAPWGGSSNQKMLPWHRGKLTSKWIDTLQGPGSRPADAAAAAQAVRSLVGGIDSEASPALRAIPQAVNTLNGGTGAAAIQSGRATGDVVKGQIASNPVPVNLGGASPGQMPAVPHGPDKGGSPALDAMLESGVADLKGTATTSSPKPSTAPAQAPPAAESPPLPDERPLLADPEKDGFNATVLSGLVGAKLLAMAGLMGGLGGGGHAAPTSNTGSPPY